MNIKNKEDNPFNDEQVAKEWIHSVENEKGGGRDQEIYPRLRNWINKHPVDLVVEIGSGQGVCADKLGNFKGKYIGVEPSATLVKRAEKLYDNDSRDFIIGDAYDLPVESETADAAFAVNVWFHLANLDKASRELSRILKFGGRFMIITANPQAEKVWESFYLDYERQGNKIIGKVKVPHQILSKNIYYRHAESEIMSALKNNGLKMEEIDYFYKINGEDLFLSVSGIKNKI